MLFLVSVQKKCFLGYRLVHEGLCRNMKANRTRSDTYVATRTVDANLMDQEVNLRQGACSCDRKVNVAQSL